MSDAIVRSSGACLAIGRPPRPADRLLVAELAAGPRGVADVLLAAAKADRWLVPDPMSPSTGWRVLADARVKDPLGAALKERIAGRSRAVSRAELASMAHEIALKDRDARVSVLARDGLVVGPAGRLGRSVGLFVLADVAAGAAYLTVTHHADDVVLKSIGLICGMFAVIAWPTSALNLVLMSQGAPMRTALGNRTLAWLRESNAALLEDVRSCRRLDAESIAMAAALGGTRAPASASDDDERWATYS